MTSPGANQNAGAAAAAAAILAAVNTANPSSQSDMHSMSSRPPSVPNMSSRPPSIHAKDPRSPATSIISDHKSESGGSGINEIRASPSPARSSRNTPQLAEPTAVMNFSSDIETGTGFKVDLKMRYVQSVFACAQIFLHFFYPNNELYKQCDDNFISSPVDEAC